MLKAPGLVRPSQDPVKDSHGASVPEPIFLLPWQREIACVSVPRAPELFVSLEDSKGWNTNPVFSGQGWVRHDSLFLWDTTSPYRAVDYHRGDGQLTVSPTSSKWLGAGHGCVLGLSPSPSSKRRPRRRGTHHAPQVTRTKAKVAVLSCLPLQRDPCSTHQTEAEAARP